MNRTEYHVPVLLEEVPELLVTGGGVYVDGTLGGGGHFRAVAEKLSELSSNSGLVGNGGLSSNTGLVGNGGLLNDNELSSNSRLIGNGGLSSNTGLVGNGGLLNDNELSSNTELPGNTKRKAVLIGIDRDREAVDNALRVGFEGVGAEVIVERSRFSEFDAVLRKYNIEKVQGLFVDLGVSSRQIDAPERGFAYMADAALDMRMDDSGGVTAARLLAESGEAELADILEKYGEIRNANRMAKVIKDYMKNGRIDTSADLKACIEREYGPRVKIQAFAKLFQALRIAVNDELGELRSFLDKSVKYLASGGRLAVISYHSLEDRMVKEFLRSAEKPCVCPPHQPVCTCGKPVLFNRVNRKAIVARPEEIARNPRARSARLRVAERT